MESWVGVEFGVSSFPRCPAARFSPENLCDAGRGSSGPFAAADFCWAAEALLPTDTEGCAAEPGRDGARSPGACWEHLRSSQLDLLRGGGVPCGAEGPDSRRNHGGLSLTDRVEMNRHIVQQMLTDTQRRPISSQSQRREGVAQWKDAGSVPLNQSDSGISLQDGENNQRLSAADPVLGPGHEQAKRRVEKARMKARSFPLKADHSLLALHTHTPSGLRPVQQADLRGKEGVASLSGTLSDSSSGESACGPPWRRSAPSPTRVRFEDETEKEAESRYLERQRQRRRAGERAQGLLVSKPDLSAYINGRKEAEQPGSNGTPLEARSFPNRRQRKGRPAHCDSCGTALEALHPHPPPPLVPELPDREGRSLYRPAPDRPRLTLRTERIKETYIGSISPGNNTRLAEGGGGGGDSRAEDGAGRAPAMRVRRRTNRTALLGVNGHLPLDIPQATPTSTANGAAEMLLNPYTATPIQTTIPQTLQHASVLTPPTSSSSSSSPPQPRKPAPNSGSRTRPDGTQEGRLLNQRPESQGEAAETHKELQENVDPCVKTWSCSSERNPGTTELAGEDRTPPTCSHSSDGRIRGPIRAEQREAACPSPEQCSSAPCRDGGSRLSLCRIFSAVGLRRDRTGSLDRLSSRPRPSSPGPASPNLRKRSSSNVLRKTPSLQSLSTQGSPFLQLRKSSSFQSFPSDQKSDRSAAYSPASCRGLQRALSVEDVGSPSSVRPVGKVTQVFSDGTLLLQLSRPPNGAFGFLISRGRGRPDSGVYVEDMVDSSTEKLYAGLLGAGDEIVEVNGEKVAGLSLDLVTRLLTQTSCASIRILRNRKLPPH